MEVDILSPLIRYTVKGGYVSLLNQQMNAENNSIMTVACSKLWKTYISSKVSIFIWRLLLNRLPTREALAQHV